MSAGNCSGNRKWFSMALLGTALSACASSPGGLGPLPRAIAAAPSGQSFEQDVLAVHNAYRAAHGVPPLRWSDSLAAGARAYGPQLAAQGRLAHSPRETRPGQGENLWMGTAGAYSPRAMVESWGSERTFFRPAVFPNVSSTGNWMDVGHYTQMIWRSTTEVGCALQRSGGWDYLICRYAPAGNRDGQPVP